MTKCSLNWYSIIFSLILYTSYTYTLPNEQRDCIILLDQDDNDNVGAPVWFLMSRVQSAIAEQSTPILMSDNLWNSFIERRMYFEHMLKQENSDLCKTNHLYQSINERMKDLSARFSESNYDVSHNKQLVVHSINQEFYHNKETVSALDYQCLLDYYTDFDPQDWDIYTNNGGFYLFIPKKYSDRYSAVGFKTNSLEKVNYPEDSPSIYFKSRIKKSVIDSLPDFFLTHDDFEDTAMPYAWNIVLAGHGGSRYIETNCNNTITWLGEPIISNLTVQDFENMLEFFHSQVQTNALVYSSCYAGGNHIPLIFNNNSHDSYNFTIICENLTDCATYCKWTTLLPSSEKPFLTTADIVYDSTKQCWQLPLTPVYHWHDFFTALRSIDFANANSFDTLHTVLSHIVYPIIANIPLVCLANTSHFFPLQAPDTIKIDDRLLALVEESNDCLTLNDVKTIFVETTVIPTTIELTHATQLRIISIQPGDALHYIKKITASSFIDIPSAFWQAQYQRYNKTFIVDELSFFASYDFQDIFPQNTQIVLRDVIIVQKKSQYMRIFFTFNNQKMMVVAHKPTEENEKATVQEVVVLTDEAQKHYEEYYASLKNSTN